MKLYDRIREQRLRIGMSQDELAEKMGYKSRSTIAKIESGKNDITQSKIEQIAKALGTTPAYLMGIEQDNDSANSFYNILPVSRKKIPFLGDIACGEPVFANEEKNCYIDATSDMKADFCLKAKGDSMINARIFDGDIVFIKQQPIVENGEIAAVIINDEATLKRVYYYPNENRLMLIPENPKYKPFIYIGEELNTVKILGKAIAFQSEIL